MNTTSDAGTGSTVNDEGANQPSTNQANAEPSATVADRPSRNDLLTTIQPGGGIVMSIELAWGFVRRWLLRTFRGGYVAKMRGLRRGEAGDIPFDPVDPRDVKYYRNQTTYFWDHADDPFTWRDRLPIVREGLGELVILGGGLIIIAVLVGLVWWPLALAPMIVAGWVVWFFRDPNRTIPDGPGDVVSPADGKLVLIESIEDPVLGPCMQFGIFLSIFNVHANRASIAGEVVSVEYRPGKMLNALRDESTRENENLDVILQPSESTGARYRIRQITGQFARRIVCNAKVGDRLRRGEMYGMIKLGSRTELILPRGNGLVPVAKVGDKVSAGCTVMARYEDPILPAQSNPSLARPGRSPSEDRS